MHPEIPSKPGPGQTPLAPGAPPQRPAGPRYSSDQDHLLDRLAVVARYRRIALAVFVLTAGAIMVQGYSKIAMYQAQARLLIEDERSTAMPGITNPESMYWQDPEPYYNTQYRILRGRDLTRRVIKRLDLQNVPEFNGTAEPPAGPAVIARQLVSRLIGFLRPPEPVVKEAPRPDETTDEAALVDAFISRVQVVPVTGSRLVDIYFQSIDPKFAADAANALVDEYVAQNLEVKLQSTQNMLEWLEKELADQQGKVEDSERALANYRDRENAMSLDDRNNIVLSRLNALNDAMLKARTTRIEKDAVYSQVKSVADLTAAESIPIVSQNPQIQTLKLRLADLQRQKAQLGERYGERHPEMVKVNTGLADAQRQLDIETNRVLQSVKNEYDRAVLEERTLAANLDQAKADVQDLSRKSVAYNVMEREARSNRTVYEALLQREKELRVSSNSRSNNVRVIDHAEVPGGPVSPSGSRAWLMAILVGLAAALGVAYGLDYLNDTIKTPEDVTRHLKMAFLGLVPSVRGNKHPILGSSHSPHDFGEAFRSLRTSLNARYGDATTKTMVVTSAQPLEGKTTTACNIAMALAYGGARVLLVDADMRRPGLHRPLRLTNDRGLSQVLSGQARVRDVIQRTVDPNLLAITAGSPPPNPSELLASERMKTLLTNFLHGPFDWIIIDTPPVLAVTDAVVLAPMVSGVTFVVGAEMTRRRLAERAIETVLASHPKHMGVVLNKVDFAKNKYYYSRYHGHQYKNYYAEAV
ncbi:MAG: GumC family protein [Vicinamibacterales bacterium]